MKNVYVLDASVALKSLLEEEDSDKAIQLIESFQDGMVDLIAPDSLLVESRACFDSGRASRDHSRGRGWQALCRFSRFSSSSVSIFRPPASCNRHFFHDANRRL